jgi:hypothetical protein
MLSVYPSVGRDWNHESAAFRRPAALAKPLRRAFLVRSGTTLMAETASLEASVGRDRRKLLRLELTVAHRVINWHAGLRGQKTVARSLGLHGNLRSERLSHCHQAVGG